MNKKKGKLCLNKKAIAILRPASMHAIAGGNTDFEITSLYRCHNTRRNCVSDTCITAIVCEEITTLTTSLL